MQKVSLKIDKLTNSIINRISGDVFETVFFPISKVALNKLKGWKFDWVKESSKSLIFKMCITENEEIIQGLIAIQDKNDHIFVSLVENAPFNIGKEGLYYGVGGNLFAFACKISFEKDYDGYVSFEPKTAIIKHYQEKLGAILIARGRMILDTKAAHNLVEQYFKPKK